MANENDESSTFNITGGEAPDDSADASREEKIAVKALRKEYATARAFDENARKQYTIDRLYASGKILKQWASSANLVGSFIDILTSFLYAKDPDVSTLAAKNVGGSTQDNADFAETLGIIISRLWKKARLKKAARKCVRSSLSVGPGWLKVIMTHETRRDPLVEKELNDVEDNIARLNALQLVLDEDKLEEDEVIAKLQEAQLLQESLAAKVEIVFNRGLAVDFVNAEDMTVSSDVNDMSDHLDADFNGNEIYILTDELRAKFPRLTDEDVKAADVYFQRKQKTTELDGDVQPNEVDMGFTAKEAGRFSRETADDGTAPTFARVVEVWDNRDNHIKTFIYGINKWAAEPFMPPYKSSRFYPYFNVSFFEVDGERHPQSLSSRLLKLQDEYSHKRSSARLHTERSVGGIIFDNTGVTKEDMRKIEGAVSQEYVGINPTKGDDIRKLFTQKPVAVVDPLTFATGPVISDMERISGIQEALSQASTSGKTATEAKIQQTGFTSRTGSDRDTLEETLDDLAVYTAEIAIQALPPEDAARLAGDKAFWPHDMDVEDLLTLAEVEIEAGSTGKPDDESLRQSWSVLLPLVQQGMVAIQEAQLTGNIPMANALRALIRETMRRLDERIDIEQFIPQGELNPLDVNDLPPNRQPGGAQQTGEPKQTSADANTLV